MFDRNFFISILLFITLSANAQSISGRINDAHGQTIFLQTYEGHRSISIDSCVTGSKGEFRMRFPETSYHGIYRLLLLPSPDPDLQIALDMFFFGNDIILQTNFRHPFDSLKYFDKTNEEFGKFISGLYSLHKRLDLLEYMYEEYPEGKFRKKVNSESRKLKKQVDKLYRKYLKENNKHISYSHIKFRYSTDPFLHAFPDGLFTAEVFKDVYFDSPSLARDAEPCRYISAVFGAYYPVGANRSDALAYMEEFTDAVIKATSHNTGLQNSLLEYLITGFEQMGAYELLERLLETHYTGLSCSDEHVSDIRERISRTQSVLPGKIAPEIQALSLDDNPFDNNDLRNMRRLIIFWSPFCSHCIDELPAWERLKIQLNEKGLVVAGISLAEDKVVFAKMHKSGLPFNISLSLVGGWMGQSARDWAISSTPTLYLIDENNRISGRFRSPEEVLKYLQ